MTVEETDNVGLSKLKNTERLLLETQTVMHETIHEMVMRRDKLEEACKRTESMSNVARRWHIEEYWRNSNFIYKGFWKLIYHTINFVGYFIPGLFCSCCIGKSYLYQIQSKTPKDKLLQIWWYPGVDYIKTRKCSQCDYVHEIIQI